MSSFAQRLRRGTAGTILVSPALTKAFLRLALDERVLERLVADSIFVHRVLTVDAVRNSISKLLHDRRALEPLIASDKELLQLLFEYPTPLEMASSNAKVIGSVLTGDATAISSDAALRRLRLHESVRKAVFEDDAFSESFLSHPRNIERLLRQTALLKRLASRREMIDIFLEDARVANAFLQDQRTIETLLRNAKLLGRIVQRGPAIEAILANEHAMKAVFDRLGRSEQEFQRLLDKNPRAIRPLGKNPAVQAAVFDSPGAEERAAANRPFLKRLRKTPVDHCSAEMAQSSDDPAKLEHRDWMNIVYVRQFLEFLSAKGFECRAMLDVGANKAEWSDQFKTVYPGSSVFMIEPLEEMRPYLEKFSEGHPDAKFVIAGAGPAAGELEFTVWPSLSGSSFVPQAGDPLYDTYAKRTVPIVAIDDLIESNEMPVPDVAKLDVQGFELEVLQGAKRLFGTTEVFFMEVSLFNPLGPKMPTLVDVVTYMHDRGYVAYDIVGFYRRRKDHALGQCDMVFVKRDSALREYKGLTRKFDWDFMRYSE